MNYTIKSKKGTSESYETIPLNKKSQNILQNKPTQLIFQDKIVEAMWLRYRTKSAKKFKSLAPLTCDKLAALCLYGFLPSVGQHMWL
jgi:hypothetical protein